MTSVNLPMTKWGGAKIAALLDECRTLGRVVDQKHDEELWRVHRQLSRHAFSRRLAVGEDDEVALGFLGRSWAREALCMTALPRALVEQYGCRVSVVRHRSTYFAMKNNPALAGFRNEELMRMAPHDVGVGHMIQRLQCSVGIPIAHVPRPEVYLTQEEEEWAWKVRSVFPRDIGVALIVTPPGRIDTSLWRNLVRIIRRRFTPVQLVVSQAKCTEEVLPLNERSRHKWRPHQVLDGVMVLENLTARQFLALFAVADALVSSTSGATHAAAAFDVPTLVVTDESELVASPYRYPQHSYLLTPKAKVHDEVLEAQFP